MKLQKIMLNAGFTCPNRDGHVGVGGCTFCRTESFNPSYCHGTIAQQLEAGKRFFAGKYPEMRYLAYFQAFSNTYGPLEQIRQRFEEALAVEDVVGLVIGTRPDCIPDELLAYLQELQQRGKNITIELGVESLYDRTLTRVNRGHTAQCSIDCIQRCAAAGFPVCIHLIFGLPGETEEDILHQADILNTLSISSIKIHQLQILRDTRMADEWQLHPDDFLSPDVQQYASLVAAFIRRLNPAIHIERFASSAPPSLLIHPRWGLKPSEVQKIIEQQL